MILSPFSFRLYCAFWILSSCFFAPSAYSDSSSSAKSLSIKAVQLNVPFEKQEDPRDCGLAVLKMINSYYGQKLNQAQIDWIKNNSEAGEGVMASELIIVLKAADYETALFQGTLDQETTGLYHHLDKNRPLIVMITSKDRKSSHYDIITGYDPIKSLLLIMDPAVGPVTVSSQEFKAAWERANNLTLLAVPKKLLEKAPTPTH
jgi:ABC-type bacteriocin/lantibiotic exporter with double-glycine peptidase domain